MEEGNIINKKTEKKLGVMTNILIILLVIRLVFQYVLFDITWISGITGLLYLGALIGVFKKQKWGSSLVMIIAVIDILFAFAMSGAFSVGAGIGNFTLLFLGYKEYKKISSSLKNHSAKEDQSI